MKTILITPPTEKDFEFISDLLEKLGYDTRLLSEEDKEDYALLRSMLREKSGDYVSEDEVNEALKK
jgi:hypothetical protein